MLQELDDDLSSKGKSKWAMSRDISQNGIGFVCAEPIGSQYIRVNIVEDNISVIGIVRHIRQLTTEHEQYFVGVQFLDEYSCHER